MKKLWETIMLGAALGLSAMPVSADAGTLKDEDDVNEAMYYITVQAEFDHNVTGDSELHGTLFNTSTEYAFDDVVLNIDFYDEENNLLDTQFHKLDEDVAVGEDEDFRIRIDAPAGTRSASWRVSSAEDED